MNSRSFDNWTRTHATTANRRSLLGWSLTAGLATALSRLQPTAAQFGNGGSCTLAVTLTSSLPGGGSTSGTLVLDIGDGGAIDTGSLTLAGQPPASVVGQATGPAIALLAALQDGTKVFLNGVSGSGISTCSGSILGVLANADAEQIGTWEAQPGGSAPLPTSTPTPPNATGGTTNQAPPPAVPTATPTPATAACDPPKMICGSNCCPAGADCFDNGTCQCPDGTEECTIACFPSCADGTPLDPVTCLCPTG